MTHDLIGRTKPGDEPGFVVPMPLDTHSTITRQAPPWLLRNKYGPDGRPLRSMRSVPGTSVCRFRH